MLLSEDACPWDINVDTTDVYFYDKLVENTWNPIGNGWRLEPEGGTLSIECYDASVFPPFSCGGIRYSGDIAKALGAGADAVMIGSLLAGTDETPGEIFYYQGRSYKSYRGMGSIAAMARGSADRYFQQDIKDQLKLVPEGIEGRVPYRGPVKNIIDQLIGGLKSSMGYLGAKNLKDFQKNAKFIEISNSGIKEGHVHDVQITKQSPNYPVND